MGDVSMSYKDYKRGIELQTVMQTENIRLKVRLARCERAMCEALSYIRSLQAGDNLLSDAADVRWRQSVDDLMSEALCKVD